jgi:hypothetical protein
VIALACGQQDRASVGSADSDAAVYAAVLDSAYRGALPDTLVLEDSTAVFHARDGTSVWSREHLDSVPGELVSALARLSARPRPSGSLALPRPIRVFTEADLVGPSRAACDAARDEFTRRYPRAQGYLSLSPIGYSADRTQALVYSERGDGGCHRSGVAVWLVRDGGGAWRHRQLIGMWRTH